MKTPPKGYSSTLAWERFDSWCTTHAVPDETEDWEYLWECWLDGINCGREIAGIEV